MKKSSLKTTCFVTSIFSRFGLGFWRFWEPLGPLLGGFGPPKCARFRGCTVVVVVMSWTNQYGPAECAKRSAAPPQVAPRAESKIKVLAKYLQAQDAQLQKPRPRSPDYPLSISPPGSAHSAGPTQNLRRTSGGRPFFRFFRLPKRLLKFASKNHRKKCENRGFRLPKTFPKSFQNASEIDVPKNMGFFSDFGSKNASLQKCRHQQNIGFFQSEWLSDVFLCVAFCMDFQAQKPSQNLSKTMPGRLQHLS